MRRAGLIGVFVSGVTWLGCGPAVATPDGGDTTATSSTSTTTSTATTTTTTATAGDDGPGQPPDADFIVQPDVPSADNECDLWTGDGCEPGEKCMPWDNTGGSAWNATKCSPIAPDPAGPGEPCMVQGSGARGVDDCEAFSMCWDVDPETNTGTCVAFCSGSEASPVCTEPCTTCSINGSGTLILCLPNCDPLLQDCSEGQACYGLLDAFGCIPDASGEAGAAGDPCEYLNVCDPGLFCANADSVEGCAGSQGCCAPYCTLGSADPCPGLGPDTECVPYFETEPPPIDCQAGDIIGVCIVPT